MNSLDKYIIIALLEGLNYYRFSIIALYFLSISAISSYILYKSYPFIVNIIISYPVYTITFTGIFLSIRRLRNAIKHFYYETFIFPIFDWYIQDLTDNIIKNEKRRELGDISELGNIPPEIKRMLSQR